MTFEKGVKGKHNPPPLPMYQPVVLKHVPTMVRRRYENLDASKIHPNDKHEDLATTFDSGGEVDADEIDACYPPDMDECVENEMPEIQHEFLSNEQGLCKSENYSLQDAHLSREVDAVHVPDDCECSVLVNHCKREDDSLSSEKNVGVADDFRQSADVYSIDEDNAGALSKDVGDRCLPPTVVASHACDLGSNIENETRDKEDTGSVNVHGFLTGHSKSAANGAEDSKPTLETSVEDEALGVANGPPSEISDSEGHEAEVANLVFNVDYSHEDKENGHTNVDNHHIIQEEKYTEDCGADNHFITSSLHQDVEENGNGAEYKYLQERTISCHVNATVKDEVRDEEHHYHDNEQDFNPKSNKEGQDAEEDYDLYCPVCEQCITRTIIFQRRKNEEQYRTTCFSWLISQFCCIR